MLDTVYEDHIESDPTVAVRNTFAFLGIPDLEVDVPLARIQTQPIRAYLRNFEEVAEHLAGTRHAWMLNE